MGKVTDTFTSLKEHGKKAFTVYLPFGYPRLTLTKQILSTLCENGVDLIELGIPFSDPVADGAILQEASQVAITHGANTDTLFAFLGSIRSSIRVPIVLMTYFNPVFACGVKNFLIRAADAGAAGCMIVDLPVEEAGTYIHTARARDLDTIFFITPVTPWQRARKIISASRGFIYYISVTGITGPKKLSMSSIKTHIRKIREAADIPVCVGFGIHDNAQVRAVSRISDGVIVGSAVAQFIKTHYRSRGFYREFARFIRALRKGL